MPWKSLGANKFSFSGSIGPRMGVCERWFKEDSKNNPGADFAAYLTVLVSSYAALAKGKWSTEWLGGRKARKLDEFLGQGQQGAVSIRVFDLLDYLAEILPASDWQAWESHSRAQARTILKLG